MSPLQPAEPEGGPHRGGAHAWGCGKPDAVEPNTAGTVMTSALITVPVDFTVEDALRRMSEHDVHHLLLEDRERIVAIVSDRDLRTTPTDASRTEEQRAQRPVFQRAHYQVVWVPQSMPLERVAWTMLAERVSSLVVMNEAGEVAGIVTSRDLLRHLALEHAQHLWPEAS